MTMSIYFAYIPIYYIIIVVIMFIQVLQNQPIYYVSADMRINVHFGH